MELGVVPLKCVHVVPDVLFKGSDVVGQGEGANEIDGHTCLQGLQWVHPDVCDVWFVGEVSIVLGDKCKCKVLCREGMSHAEADRDGARAA